MEGSLKGEDTQGIIPQSFTEIFKEIEQLGDKVLGYLTLVCNQINQSQLSADIQ